MSDKKAVVIETGDDTGKKDREGLTGKPRKKGAQLTVSRKDWDNFLDEHIEDLESEGKFELASRLRGEKYDPSFGERAKHTAIKMKSATVTVLLAAVTPLAVILVWEGIRLVIPKARTLPGFIKYKSHEEVKGTGGKVVRLAAGSR